MRARNWITALALVLVTGCGGCGYNRIVQEEQQVEQQWSQVENQLQRRADLIPNLVEVAKGYAAHETQVFTNIANARAALTQAQTRSDKIAASDQLTSALGQFRVVVEAYPQLKADTQFTRLMDELAGTENRLAVERKRYNEAVQQYNTDVRGIPGAWWAKIGGFPSQKEYFKAAPGTQAVPKVSFEH